MVQIIKKIIIMVILVLGLLGILSAQRLEILGAGATFPYPLYSKMFDEYSNVADRVNYQVIGSGGGINQLVEMTVDFGGTDAIVSAEIESGTGNTILHVPTCLGAVVITYNLQIPNNAKLKFTSDVIADIFLGTITSWNDSRIRELNPGVNIPNRPITVVYRSEASGTTNIFTEYLEKTNQTWATSIGSGTTVRWPVGIGARGNPGVAASVQQTPGAIGYVELIYALSNDMPFGDVRNKAGNYITPTIESVTIAANVDIPADTKVSLTDTDAAQGYPLSSFTWVILFKEQSYNNRPIERGRATHDLVNWMITDGQSFASALNYAPLPEAAKQRGLDLLKSMTFNGQPLR